MSNVRTAKALEAALAYLQQALRETRARGETRLPGAARLAHQARVSRGTMVKALRVVAAHGIVSATPGGRYALDPERLDRCDGTAFEVPRRHGPSGRKCRQIADMIERDMIEGRSPLSDPLPTIQQLGYSYGGSYVTIRKSLDILVERGVLDRSGRGYRRRRMRSEHANTLVLITRGLTEHNEPMLLTHRTTTMLRRLEEDCSRQRIRLRVFSVYFEEHTMRWAPELTALLEGGAGSEHVVGYVVWTAGLRNDTSFLLASRYLARQKRPVAIHDYHRSLPRSLFRRTGTPLACFQHPREFHAGETMGRYVLHRGCRSVRFISHEHKQPWSRERLAGFRSCLEPMGIPLSVTTVDGLPGLSADNETQRIRDLYEERLSRMGPPEEVIKQRSIMDGHFRTGAFLRRLAIHRQVSPLLQRAYREPPVDVWVCVNDQLALMCLDFLDTRKVAVPADTAVASFDNTVEASMWRLTSYHFNDEALVDAMVGYVLGSEWIRRSRNDEPVGVRGHVVARDTA